jgi:pimeloyl-ACP methyl ester carboxylesterase
MNPSQMARIMQNLMQRLGHSSYVVCGGDWGSAIGTYMAQLYPGHVRGLFVTMTFPSLTWKHHLQLLAGHYINPSIVLDIDEQKFLKKPFNAFYYLTFLW